MALKLGVDLRVLLEDFPSGVSVYTREMIRELAKHKDVDLFLFYQASKPKSSLHKEFPGLHFVQCSNFFFHLRSLFAAPLLPEDYFPENLDLIWLPDRRPFYKCDIPVTMTVHDAVPEKMKSTLSWRGRVWHCIFNLKRLSKYCAGFLFPSESVQSQFRYLKPAEVTFEGARSVKMTMPAQAKRLKKGPFMLFLAPADKRKGISLFYKMVQRFPKLNFVWLGEKKGDKRFSFFKRRNYENLISLGQVLESEKQWLLRHSSALLALSEMEGFDLPVLEAVHAKCPVIMSDISVHKELYKKGDYFSRPEDLIWLIKKAMNNQISVPVPRRNYSWDLAARQALLLFRRVIVDENRKRSGHGNRNDHP